MLLYEDNKYVYNEFPSEIQFQESITLLNEDSFQKTLNKFLMSNIKFNLGLAPHIIMNNLAYLVRIKSNLNKIETKEEKDKLISRLEKDLKGFKRNKSYWTKTGNIIPVVDRKAKEKSIDRTIQVTEEILEELKKKKL